jgi:leucyl aminopeptidase
LTLRPSAFFVTIEGMIKTIQIEAKAFKSPDAVVAFVFTDRKVPVGLAESPAIKRAIKRPDTRPEVGAVTVIDADGDERLVLVGLGDRQKLSAESIRAAADGLVKRLDVMQAARVTVLSDVAVAHVDAGLMGRSLGEGMGLAAFRFDAFKGRRAEAEREKRGDKAVNLRVHLTDRRAADGFEQGTRLAASTNLARQLAATPPNVATTTWIAQQARKIAASSTRLSCRVYQKADLERMKLVGLLNVGKASENPPVLIEMVYEPRRRARRTVLLVGKTMAYDTGGLSLKVNNGMLGMKYDKCGGMAVLGAMHALAHHVEPDVRVVALLPTAENSISDEAMRPDDILTYRNGVTVEVTNTDAEGRLILADALAYGCEKHKPEAVIDLATLTGGVVVALGHTHAGYWCEDGPLRRRLETASEMTGERLWRMPMHEAYRKLMHGDHADIVNSARVRDASPIQGAAFLTWFVPADLPWAHIDIAGTANLEKAEAPLAAGPTGFGVRLLSRLLADW